MIVPGGTVAKGKEKAGRARSRREVLYGGGSSRVGERVGPAGVRCRSKDQARSNSQQLERRPGKGAAEQEQQQMLWRDYWCDVAFATSVCGARSVAIKGK